MGAPVRHMISLIFAVLILIPPAGGQSEPPSCQQYWARQSQCGRGRCDAPSLERLRKECLREGRPQLR